MKKTKLKVGDIFSMEIAPGEYAFGRILLDVHSQCAKKGFIDGMSNLDFGYNDTILIELYKGTNSENKFLEEYSEILISSLFTIAADIALNYWSVVGYKEVDPTKIDFPEFLLHNGALGGKYIKGEITYTIPTEWAEVANIDIFRSQHASITIPEVVLYALGRTDEVKMPPEKLHRRGAGNSDIRYSEYKERIHALLPEEFKKPYYEMAKEKGLG
ncbi:MAG: hypothetical protein ACJAXI_003500 [Crocinitomicaceae bacterium]|jgi:hypothetical protein